MTDNEKTVLEKLYDELRAELSTTQLNCDMWHDRAEDMRNRLSAVQADNAKLRKLAVGMYVMLEMVDTMLGNHDACETPRPLIFGEDKSFKDVMRELGVGE